MIILPVEHPDWEFLKLGAKDKNNQPTPPANADFAILAYGINFRIGDSTNFLPFRESLSILLKYYSKYLEKIYQ